MVCLRVWQVHSLSTEARWLAGDLPLALCRITESERKEEIQGRCKGRFPETPQVRCLICKVFYTYKSSIGCCFVICLGATLGGAWGSLLLGSQHPVGGQGSNLGRLCFSCLFGSSGSSVLNFAFER